MCHPLCICGHGNRGNEFDIVGFRDNNFVAGGHEVNGTRTRVSRDGISGNILGFGTEIVNETSLPKNFSPGTKKSSTITETLNTPIFSTETTTTNGTTQTQSYIGLSFKAALFIGIEFELKVPVGNNSANLSPPKNGQYVDNATVKPIIPNN